MNKLIKELKNFSKQNWWVYLVLLLCLIIIYITWKWSVTEVLFTFTIYFTWELTTMIMVTLMTEKNYKISSIFQFLWFSIFTSLFIYNYFQHWQFHYVLASVPFFLSAMKNLLKFNLQIDSRHINWLTLFIIGIIFMILWNKYWFFSFDTQISLQYIWFILFPTSLIMTDKYEKSKYIIWLIWLLGFVIWWSYWIYNEFIKWEILGITICFTLMPLTVLIVYLKNINKYLPIFTVITQE